MTEIKKAIEQIQTEMIKDIDIPKSAKTELANQKALHLAINSLNAWEDVLNELEELAMQHLENGESESYADVSVCIDHIKIHLQKLAED